MIGWNGRYDSRNMKLEYALNAIRDDGKCMIFIIGEVCIISMEQAQGPKKIFVLCNKM